MAKQPIKKTKSFLWLYIILLIVVGVSTYANSFRNEFVFDDLEFIVRNPYVRSYQAVQGFWYENFPKTRMTALYSFAWNYQMFKLNVVGYHAFNFIIHLLCAFFVWWFGFLLFKTPLMKEEKISAEGQMIAFCAALFFIAHPAQTQAVSYISQRFASMATLFYVMGLCFYLKARLLDTKKVFRLCLFAGALMAVAIGMTCKEILVTWPFAVVLVEFLFLRESDQGFARKHLKFFIFAAVVFIVVFLVMKKLFLAGLQGLLFDERASESHDGDVYTFWTYLLTQTRVFVTFLRLLFVPVGLNLDYDFVASKSLFELRTLFSTVFLSIFLGTGIVLRRSRKIIAFGIFWFFITLSANLVPRVNVIFEHKLYLVSVGFCIAISAAIFQFSKKRKYAIAVVSVLVVVLAVMTHFRNRIWKTELTLWTDVVKKSPKKARPNQNLGKVLIDHGKYDLAIEYLNKSLEGNDQDHKTYMDRGVAYYHKKMYEFALADLNKAVELKPDYYASYSNRGLVYVERGRPDLAIQDYQTAIKLKPTFQIAYVNRGNLLAKIGQFDYAIKDYTRAAQLSPENVYPVIARGITYFKAGKYDNALEDFNTALKMDPNDARIYGNRGYYYLKMEKYDLAIQDLEKAISINDKYEEAYNNLGSVYFKLKEYEQAMMEYNKTLEINPKHSKGYHNRGVILSIQGQHDPAVIEFTKAIEIDPGYAQAYWSRAMANRSRGHYQEALDDLAKLQSLGQKFDENLIAEITRQRDAQK